MIKPSLASLLLATIAVQDCFTAGVTLPENLVPDIIAAMKQYEMTKTCQSYMNIVMKVSNMEKILCSTADERLCSGAKAVSKFFSKVLFSKLPVCLRGLISRTRNKNMLGVGWSLG